MRVNVYNEEVTDRVESTAKVTNTVEFTGIQFFIGPEIEHTPGDDDSSAVTFWFSDEYTRKLLIAAFEKAIAVLNDPANKK